VIRNAGGVVTEDEIRSLTISQRLLGTKEIILIHHTDCGMLGGFKRSSQHRGRMLRWQVSGARIGPCGVS
jgi:carbonic anhydrase